MDWDIESLDIEKGKHEPWLGRLEGVTGTGIGLGRDGRPCLKIYTNQISEETDRKVRAVLAGVPWEFEETGEFHAF
jgi:hypothetical protein